MALHADRNSSVKQLRLLTILAIYDNIRDILRLFDETATKKMSHSLVFFCSVLCYKLGLEVKHTERSTFIETRTSYHNLFNL
jgi:hypothetical protein